MNKMLQEVKLEINKLEKLIVKIDDFLRSAPEGCLKWQHKGDRLYYYQQTKNDLKWKRKYITKENMVLAKLLAKKHYYVSLKGVISKQIKALKEFIKQCPDREIDALYKELCEERKCLIEPIEQTIEDKVNQWNEEVYEKNISFSENLRYVTEQGDKVRSKSEVIIANLLFQNKKDILYKYEKPLVVIENGKKKTIYPDFTIMNVHTGKVRYWEHAGIMDDAFYANEFVRKMNIYISNGLMIGKDVIITFESQTNALDIKVVKKLINEVILE